MNSPFSAMPSPASAATRPAGFAAPPFSTASARGAQQPPQLEPPSAAELQRLHGLYRELLRAFAEGAAPGAVAEIVDKQACTLDEVSLEFRFDPINRLLAVHADVGRAEPWQALPAAQRALELQWLQPTPAVWLLGRHPDSGHYVLLTHHVVGERPRDDAPGLLQHARGCALIAKTLRGYLFV